MKGVLKGFVEKIEGAGKRFWFEDRSKEADGKVFSLDDMFVAIGKKIQKDNNGQICEVLEIKFVPLVLNRNKSKCIDVLSGEEIDVVRKNGKIKVATYPSSLKSFDKTKECFKIIGFMEFFGEYGDYFKAAFPKTDFVKMFNLQQLSKRPDVCEGDIKKILPKVEKTYLLNAQKNCATQKKSKSNLSF